MKINVLIGMDFNDIKVSLDLVFARVLWIIKIKPMDAWKTEVATLVLQNSMKQIIAE